MHEELGGGALGGERFRVVISTDIGGSDPDDFQSLVHYLLYADLFETEGIISSPWGAGRVSDIYDVLDRYETDFPRLVRASGMYPDPEFLRSISKQGAVERAPLAGYSHATEGSDWLVRCARRPDPRPLYVLVWGTIDDVAQALHDAPDIAGRIRVYYIAGPNKKWGIEAYEYVRTAFPDLWIIENNSTYRGWFVGGNQTGQWGNKEFVRRHIAGHGALGDYFAQFLGGTIKMGDTPSVAYLLRGTPGDPSKPSWGGSFERVTNRPKSTFYRLTTEADEVELYGILELNLEGPEYTGTGAPLELVVQGQRFPGHRVGSSAYRVLFMPKSTGIWSYHIESPVEQLDGLSGSFRCVPEDPAQRHIGNEHTNWWSDLLEPNQSDHGHAGARTISMWRESFLDSFRERFDRCLGTS